MPLKTPLDTPLFVGIDMGTSGVRAMAIDAQGTVRAQAATPLEAPRTDDGGASRQSPHAWWQGVERTLQAMLRQVPPHLVQALAVDGTSGTLVCTDAHGVPVSDGWMYNDTSCRAQAQQVAQHASADSAAHGASSPLARLLHLQNVHSAAAHALHQADWIAGRLAGRFGFSDENNALKLGYDVVARRWPDWMDAVGARHDWLPQVRQPGTVFAPIAPAMAQAFGLSLETKVVHGTTDGVAAFWATGAQHVGDAVTSLGTTLVVKVLSAVPVFAPAWGIYSHRLGALWLPGGASNTGGAALLQHFSLQAMQALTPKLQPEQATGLNYYPLPSPGERFPINDAQLADRSAPRPKDDALFFQGLLEGIAGVERLAFERIAELGAPYPGRVFSVGGGARNPAWTRIRSHCLGMPLVTPQHEEAAYGCALLAKRGVTESPS